MKYESFQAELDGEETVQIHIVDLSRFFHAHPNQYISIHHATGKHQAVQKFRLRNLRRGAVL